MKTVCRVYDSYAQARAAVDAVQSAGVPASDVSIVANKYVSAEHADVDEVSGRRQGRRHRRRAGRRRRSAGRPRPAGDSGPWAGGGSGLARLDRRGRRGRRRDRRYRGRPGRCRCRSRACRRLLRVGAPRRHHGDGARARRGRRPHRRAAGRPTSRSIRWRAAPSTARPAGRRSTRRPRPTGRARPRSTACGRTGRTENDRNHDKGRRKACPSSLRSRTVCVQ